MDHIDEVESRRFPSASNERPMISVADAEVQMSKVRRLWVLFVLWLPDLP